MKDCLILRSAHLGLFYVKRFGNHVHLFFFVRVFAHSYDIKHSYLGQISYKPIFDPLMGPLQYYHSVRGYLWIMAKKQYSTLPRFPEQEPHQQFSVIPRTPLLGGGLSLYSLQRGEYS